LDALADNCLKDQWLKTNLVPLTEKKQVLEILEMAVGDGKRSLSYAGMGQSLLTTDGPLTLQHCQNQKYNPHIRVLRPELSL
jgi:hypothetical protein